MVSRADDNGGDNLRAGGCHCEHRGAPRIDPPRAYAGIPCTPFGERGLWNRIRYGAGCGNPIDQTGMGGTLGFVAVVVGLGAMLGGLLEVAGGVRALSTGMLNVFGEKQAPLALGFVGFVVTMPVFLDVALIILAPVLYGPTRVLKP